jgi:hypothetical protein
MNSISFIFVLFMVAATFGLRLTVLNDEGSVHY